MSDRETSDTMLKHKIFTLLQEIIKHEKRTILVRILFKKFIFKISLNSYSFDYHFINDIFPHKSHSLVPSTLYFKFKIRAEIYIKKFIISTFMPIFCFTKLSLKSLLLDLLNILTVNLNNVKNESIMAPLKEI